MSARTIFLWAIAGFLGLACAMMLPGHEAPVSTLEAGLGPEVAIQPL